MGRDREDNSSNPSDKSTNKSQDRGVPGGSTEPKRRRGIAPRRKSGAADFPQRTQSKPEALETKAIDLASKKFSYPKGVEDDVSAVVGEQPYLGYKRVTPVTTISSLFEYLCESTFRYVELRTMRPEPLFSLDELRYVYRYILALRLAHVSGQKMPDGARPAEIRYPAILGPLLASIGRYVHPTAALELVPTIHPRMETWRGLIHIGEGPNSFQPKEKDARPIPWDWDIESPETIDRVLSVLLALGCPMNIGLPVDTVVEGDELFRLDNDEGKLIGSGDFAPSAGTLLSRAFLELSTLAELYGEHRVVYAALATLRSAVDKLARDSFTMEVGSNGPR